MEHNQFRSTEFGSHSTVNNHNIYLIMYSLQIDWISINNIQTFKNFRDFLAEGRHRVSKMLRFNKQNLKGKMKQRIEREGIWLLRNYLKTHVQHNMNHCNKNIGTWATSVGFNFKTAEDKYTCKNESNTSVWCFWMHVLQHHSCFLCIMAVNRTGCSHTFQNTNNKVYDGKIFRILIKKG